MDYDGNPRFNVDEEVSGDQSMMGAGGLKNANVAFAKEQDLDEVIIYMPKSEVKGLPDIDPTLSLSTSETLEFYLNSGGAAASPRRNSFGGIVPASVKQMRCDHHFKKLGDQEAHGMWPAGKYKCGGCEMIICP